MEYSRTPKDSNCLLAQVRVFTRLGQQQVPDARTGRGHRETDAARDAKGLYLCTQGSHLNQHVATGTVRHARTLAAIKEIPLMIEHYRTDNMPEELEERIALLRGIYDDMKEIDEIITRMPDRFANGGGVRNGQ